VSAPVPYRGGTLGLDFVDRFWATLGLLSLIIASVISINVGISFLAKGGGAVRVKQYFQSQTWLVAMSVVLLLSYMPVIKLMITTLGCYDRPVAGVSFLESDLSVECFGPAHVSSVVAAYVVLAVFGAGFLAFVVWALRPKSTLPKETRQGFAFLSLGYEPAYEGWEAVVLLRKAALVLIGSLVSDASSQTILALAVLSVSRWLQERYKPYRLDRLETVSLMTLLRTSMLSALYLQTRGGQDAMATNALEYSLE